MHIARNPVNFSCAIGWVDLDCINNRCLYRYNPRLFEFDRQTHRDHRPDQPLSQSTLSIKARPAWLPGIMVVAGVGVFAWLLVEWQSQLPGITGTLPISMMLVAILTGLALAPLAARQSAWSEGLAVAGGPLLKLAVALLGLRLSLVELGSLGLQALPLAIIVVAFALVLTFLLARLAGAHQRLATLLAAGTAICGASAIAATAPGIRARREETGYAIACIALIGLIATLAYPLLLPLVMENPAQIGMVMGLAIHDTAQVTAAASLHDQTWTGDGALDSATVTKLLRNSFMLVIIPALVWMNTRKSSTQSDPGLPPVPLFIFGFIALSVVRTAGDAALGPDHPTWQTLIALTGQISIFAFAMAMAALAMGIRIADLKTLGWKPAAAAGLSALSILALTLLLIQ